MLTPQEVSGRAFSKAAFGGYNMAMVDEFLDELTDDYTSLYKENAALKAKLKVLVDKVEEYRATEDSMRAALLTAQRMANTMVEEAEEKKSLVLTACLWTKAISIKICSSTQKCGISLVLLRPMHRNPRICLQNASILMKSLAARV